MDILMIGDDHDTRANLQDIIEAHGGDSAAESGPGQGAEFIITLPLR